MKNSIKLVFLFALISTAVIGQNKGKTGGFVNPNSPGKILPTQAIDLKAESITFTLSRRIDANRAMIKVIGTIKNVGTEKYVSDQKQQSAVLSESYSSTATNPKLKKEQLFSTLDPGATVVVTYELEWNKSNEIPPLFVLNLSYDPDILIDGNTKNDDKNPSNDKIVVDAKTIVNAMKW